MKQSRLIKGRILQIESPFSRSTPVRFRQLSSVWRVFQQKPGFWFCLGLAFFLLAFDSPKTIAQQRTPAPAVERPNLRLGSEGNAVEELQAVLRLLGYYKGSVSGVFGETTRTAVIEFQRATGLNPDGIVGSTTWRRLLPQVPIRSTETTAAATNGNNPTTPPQPALSGDLPILRLGSRGPAVFWLQTRLSATGFFKGTVDGIFGEDTDVAVKAAQEKFKLNPDGVVGVATWRALLP
jgi:N-acetylmuramoyl-L-alanine amidase